MRRMEEEVELVGTREDFLSEDDHSPTDASEDSVEVKVTPIKAHYRPLAVSTQPLPQKVTVTAHHQRSPSPPAYKFHHKFRKHYAAFDVKQEYDLKARTTPQDYDIDRHLASPQDFSRSRESPQYDLDIKYSSQDFSIVRHPAGVIASPVHTHFNPRTPTSPVDSPMGAAPLSPGTRAAGARNRRKPAEPRRLCHDGLAVNKRAHSPEPPHKAPKVPRTDSVIIQDDKSVASSPSPGAPPLLAHHPLLGPLARPPIGGFPPLLLPPAWPPVAAQWGYPRVVTPLGWPGLTPGLTPHHYPMLIPHPYPLSRPLLHPHMHPTSPPPKSPPPRPPSEDHIREDLPIPLVTRVPSHLEPPATSSSRSSSTLQQPHHPPTPHPHHLPAVSREVSVVKKVGKAPSKFLSVESLIATDKPAPPTREPSAPPTVIAAVPSEGDDDVSTSLQGEDDETIHSLMQPNKQKQRNYKNMTRERRIEANARERNRVHTISAAFEKLRTSVPAYSHNQKLSKLSVLRIACSYILLLSRLAGHDYSEGGTEPSISECVDLTTRTIQVEGKAKKKRDE